MPIQPKQQPPYYQAGTPAIKQYIAKITQPTPGEPPTVTEIKNTIATIIWSRVGTGSYKGIFDLTTTQEEIENKLYSSFGQTFTSTPQFNIICNYTAIQGYYTIYTSVNSGKLNIWLECIDEAFTAIELNDLMGTTYLTLKIEIYV